MFSNVRRASALRRLAGLAAQTLVLVGFAAAMTGCAMLKPEPPEQKVTQRAAAYWQARVAGKIDQAYPYLTPGYRSLHTVDQFWGTVGSGAGLKGAQVVRVACEAEKCKATIRLDVVPMIPGVASGIVSTHLEDTWLLEDGQWWRYEAP